MGDATKNFNYAEFASKDGTNDIKLSTIQALQKIRDYLGVPVTVTSGYRSRKDNARVGGVVNSAHLTGEAADIYANGLSQAQLGRKIRTMYEKGLLPELQYCYLIRDGNRSVHVGFDRKQRSRVFGF